MPRTPYDPLTCIPSPDAIRSKVVETETLLQRLRVLLQLAEDLQLPLTTGNTIGTPIGKPMGGTPRD